ncbi:MAG: hypothetical protein LBC20_00020, partial [Planctomycetaceae bacterium]|nr:hypothetical protein [Planctomycetaceae bacterium]
MRILLSLLLILLLPQYVIGENADDTVKENSKCFSHLQKIEIPHVNDESIQKIFQTINIYIEALRQQDFEKLTENPQFPDTEIHPKSGMQISGKIALTNDKITYVNFYRYVIEPSIPRKKVLNRGIRLYFNKEGQLQHYFEGLFDGVPDNTKLETSQLLQGIEIHFYPNGSPSQYRDIMINTPPKKEIKWNPDGNITNDNENKIKN